MPRKRIDTGIGGLSDTPENANEEYGRGDQEFGGGPGDLEYGEEPLHVGSEGVVAEAGALGKPSPVPDDEREGSALPGTDEDVGIGETEEEE